MTQVAADSPFLFQREKNANAYDEIGVITKQAKQAKHSQRKAVAALAGQTGRGSESSYTSATAHPEGMASAATPGYIPLKPSWERVVKLPQTSSQWIKVNCSVCAVSCVW